MNWTPEELQAIVDEHPRSFHERRTRVAQCGFSNRAAQVLQALGEPFASVNILTDLAQFLRFALGLISLPCLRYSFMVN